MSKFVEQVDEGFSLNGLRVPFAVKRRERASFAKLQQRFHPWHPIGVFAVDQMANDIKRAPSVFTFVLKRPDFGQVSQKRIESSGSAGKKGNCVLQVVFGHEPSIQWQ